MHVPDGFLDAPTSLATGVVAASAVAFSLRQARKEVDTTAAPLAGLVAAFVFALQMLNFPVGVGTSGHIMGGALAAALVGPWTAVLCLTVVLAVQALFFADGGLTALGSNITLIGVVTVVVGYAITRGALTVLPKRPASVVPASFVGALISVPAAALVFVALYLVGGAVPLDTGLLTASMLGWHTLIGLGEAVITALTVSAVVATRPDLVFAARDLRPRLLLERPDGTSEWVQPGQTSVAGAARRRPARRLLVGGLVASLLLAGVASAYASSNPDGLEYVAGELAFLESADDSATATSPLSDYGVSGVDNESLSVGLAGVLGVAVTLVIGLGIAYLVARRRTAEPRADDRARESV